VVALADLRDTTYIAYRNLSSESRSVDSETVEDWKNY
jgi:hypothetical protein